MGALPADLAKNRLDPWRYPDIPRVFGDRVEVPESRNEKCRLRSTDSVAVGVPLHHSTSILPDRMVTYTSIQKPLLITE